MKYRKSKYYKYELMSIVKVNIGLPVKHGITPLVKGYLKLKEGILTIKKHYRWDGPSGPTIDTKSFMRGSLVHDALYQLIREGSLDSKYRKDADLLLKEICIEDGMHKFRAWYVYQSVRLFGGSSTKPIKNPQGKIIEI